jgi:hypothetical protein
VQLLRVVPASIAMTAVLWPFSEAETSLFTVAAAGIASGLVYVAVSLATGVWPWADVMRIWQSVRRPMAAASLEPTLLAHQELESSDIVVG